MNAKGDDVDDSDINQNNNRVRGLNNIINAPITREEIENAMKSLKNNKSSGDDYILNEYIKHSFESVSDVYVKLFNIIFDSGLIPEQWLYGNIIPVYKNKGDIHDPKMFMLITILSCFGKLFTSILNFRLNDFSDEYSLIHWKKAEYPKRTTSFFTISMYLSIIVHIMRFCNTDVCDSNGSLARIERTHDRSFAHQYFMNSLKIPRG